MNAADYKSERERRGTQEEVAALLGVARSTVARRETGALPITHEAALALLALPKRKASRGKSNAKGEARPHEQPEREDHE